MNSHIFYQSALALYLASFLAYMAELAKRNRAVLSVAYGAVVLGFLAHTVAMVMRGIEAEHVPWSNLYESLAAIAWSFTFAFIVFGYWVRVRSLGLFLLPFVLVALGYALSLPQHQRTPDTLMPALVSYWIKIHVPTVILSYGAFSVSFIASAGYLFKTMKRYEATQGPAWLSFVPDAAALDTIAYRAVMIGFPMLTLGIFLGAVWANEAWGTYWSWDPKETWSLITWFVYAGYLHARLVGGWKTRTTAKISIAGFGMVLFTYAGVNLFLSGLHSYAKS